MDGASRHAERRARISQRQEELQRELDQLLDQTVQSASSTSPTTAHTVVTACPTRGSAGAHNSPTASLRQTPMLSRRTPSVQINDRNNNNNIHDTSSNVHDKNHMHHRTTALSSSLPQTRSRVSAASMMADESCVSSADRNDADMSSIMALQRGLMMKWGSTGS